MVDIEISSPALKALRNGAKRYLWKGAEIYLRTLLIKEAKRLSLRAIEIEEKNYQCRITQLDSVASTN